MSDAIKENIVTLVCTVVLIGLIAIGTGSLHCLWGLALMGNINVPK